MTDSVIASTGPASVGAGAAAGAGAAGAGLGGAPGVELSAAEKREIDAELAHLPNRAAAAIDALKIAQAHRGWVSDGALAAVAAYLRMPAAELESVATFYNLIFRRPVGENVILLCDSVTCWIKGCDRLREAFREQLGIEPGETTADNRFTLLPIACLGACDKAPVMMAGEELHEHVTAESLPRLLAACASGANDGKGGIGGIGGGDGNGGISGNGSKGSNGKETTQ